MKTIYILSILTLGLIFNQGLAKKKPNIVLIFMDNFGWGELGCSGGVILRGAIKC